MNLNEISRLRLINQQIAESTFSSAKELVRWMGAMQAQDFAMAKWAVGLRVPGSTEQSVNDAIDNGEILRTHLLRPTWHLVTPEDIGWMLSLTAKRIKSAMSSNDKRLGLDEDIFSKTNSIIEKSLSNGQHLTRDELISQIEAVNIQTNDNRPSHMFMRAELEGIICSGKSKAGKQTFALLSERAPKTKTLHRDEALAKLAQMYFISHGPATLNDFIWWSGLSTSDSRHALEMVKSSLISETIAAEMYWIPATTSYNKNVRDSIYALPAFDEFLISYKDRTAALPFENKDHAVSNNGIFKPVIIRNGQVIGIWKRTFSKNTVIIESSFFHQTKVAAKELYKAFLPFGNFLGKEIEMR
jgi:hypothetical protein